MNGNAWLFIKMFIDLRFEKFTLALTHRITDLVSNELKT